MPAWPADPSPDLPADAGHGAAAAVRMARGAVHAAPSPDLAALASRPTSASSTSSAPSTPSGSSAPPESFAPWPCLAPGARIAVVAPASAAAPERVAEVAAWLADQGWQARLSPGCHGTGALFASPAAQALAELQAAIDDPAVQAIWCLRGGYGSNRLLPGLDLRALQARPKPLIGYSDITALQQAWHQAGLLALHAPMPASDLLLPGRQADALALCTLLRAGWRAGTVLAPALLPGAWRVPGQAQGRLVGGNLCTLAALAGTPWALRAEGALLFLEDVAEPPYKVHRLLWQLQHSGALLGVAGVLLGSFTEADDASTVLRGWADGLGVPVLAGWPCGHGTPHLPLPLGALATLDAAAGTLRLDQDVLLPCA